VRCFSLYFSTSRNFFPDASEYAAGMFRQGSDDGASVLNRGRRDFENGPSELSNETRAAGECAPFASAAPGLEQLMVAYQQGDAVAAQDLIDSVSGRLYAFFSSQLGSRSTADDMLQEAWLRIHRVRHTYRPGEPLLPWIYAIARRVRVDDYRRRHRTERQEVRSAALDNIRVQAMAAEAATLPSFAELIAPLPDSQREVLTMLKVNGLSIEEVARATSSTVGSVKQKVHRAYDQLRRLLPQKGREESGGET
jgi:RNA polymerase sigma-70 factor, ECF subfamily